MGGGGSEQGFREETGGVRGLGEEWGITLQEMRRRGRGMVRGER